MNTDTGHMVDNIDDVDTQLRELYDRVPSELEAEAKEELAGRKETYVQLDRRNSKLAKWARKRRVEKKREKAKRRTARASRRRNRGR